MRVLEVVEHALRNPRLEVEKKSNAFWPSEGGVNLDVDGMVIREGGCNRKLFYRYMDYPKDGRGIDLRGAVATTTGHTLQGLLAKALREARVFLGEEIPIQLKRKTPSGIKYSITGSIDILIQDPDDPDHGRPWIIESKSMNPWKVKKYCTPNAQGELKPRVSDVLQVFPYLDWMRTAGVADPEAHIIYVAQDGSDFGEQIVRFGTDDAAVIENVTGKFEWVDVTLGKLYADFDATAEAIRKNEVPDRPYTVQYTNERILSMLKRGELNKTQTAIVNKRMVEGDGRESSGFLLEIGDWQCNFCPFRTGCYQGFAPGDRPGLVRPDISTSRPLDEVTEEHVV